MIALLQANIIPMVAAMIIGLLTARWAFRRPPAGASAPTGPTSATDPEKSE
jgi:hypothetical protein